MERFPDELLEVVDPARPNVITDAEAIAYDDALMDEAKTHLAVIQDKQLPVEELAAYNDLNILCNHDPDMIPLLGMPYGTWLERGEDGRFYEDEESFGETGG